MTEREKIISIIEQNKYCDVNTTANCRECRYNKELANYKDMGCSSLKTADALIGANIGDVTEYKKTIRDLNTDVVAYRALSKADTLEQIIEGQKSLIDEYKHRAEIAERALATVCEEVLHSRYPVEYVTVSVVEDFIQLTLKDAEKELAEEGSGKKEI